MPDTTAMHTETFSRDDYHGEHTKHIKTDGAAINITVGLTDGQGREVTAVSVIPDRGGDHDGRAWRLEAGTDGGIRLIRDLD